MDGSFLNTRIPGDSGSTWHENKVGIIFTNKDLIRSIDDSGNIYFRLGKREYVTFFGKAELFEKYILECSLRHGYGRLDKTVLISDGASWIKKMKQRLFPNAQQILDFYHLCENVSKFSNAVFGFNSQKSKEHTDLWCELLKEGKWLDVLNLVSVFRDLGKNKKTIDLYQYIYDNRDCINYPYYREKYFFIGSGAIESANKKIVQKRFFFTRNLIS